MCQHHQNHQEPEHYKHNKITLLEQQTKQATTRTLQAKQTEHYLNKKQNNQQPEQYKNNERYIITKNTT